MAAWIPIATAGASLLGGILGQKAQRKGQQKQRSHEMQLAQYQYQKDKEMWHMMNEYNSPKAQMERFAEAGLNPNLIYGQGTAGQATTMPQYQAPRAEYDHNAYIDPLSILGNYIDTQQKLANVNHTKQATLVQTSKDIMQNAQIDGILQENTIRTLEASITQTILNDYELPDIARNRVKGIKARDLIDVYTADVKAWESRMSKEGVNVRDSIQWRQLIELLDIIGFSPSQIRNKLNR